MTTTIINARLKSYYEVSAPLSAAINGRPTALMPAELTTKWESGISAKLFANPAPVGRKINRELISRLAVSFVFSSEFFNIATLYYAYDPVSKTYLKTMKLKHASSVSNFGVERERVFYSQGIGADETAHFHLADLLENHAVPNYYVSFIYSGSSEDVEIGTKFRIDLPYVPGPEGDWEDAVCTSLSTKRRGGSLAVKSISPGMWKLTSRILTLSQSSSKSGGGIVLASSGDGVVLTVREAGVGSPALPDMMVEVNGIIKYTDSAGQVSFDISPGTYTVTIQGAGYVSTSHQITV